MESTLVILKPDALQRGIAGRIIARFEDKGLLIAAAKTMRIDEDLAARHYEAHREKPFYGGLVRFMTSAPVFVMAVRGPGAVSLCRKLMGATFGSQAEPGTIRGDFGASDTFNLVHGSDSVESAQRELALFFEPDELLDWSRAPQPWTDDTVDPA